MDSSMTTIGEIAEIFDGPHATPKKTMTGPYFLSISSLEKGRLDLDKSAHLNETDFGKWTKRVTPTIGDLLFSYETRLGEVALMPNSIRACLGRRMGLLRPKKEKVIPEYLLYSYLSPAFQQTIISNTIRGATVDRIALNELPNFNIRIPCIKEQQKVSSLLKNIDGKIDCNNRINAELEAMAKTLYNYWFLQFDFPDANGRPYQSSGGKMDYNHSLKREIPVGWEVKELGDVVKTTLGGTPATKNDEYWENASIPWLSSAETANFPVTDSEQDITPKGIDNSAALLLPKGSVVVSIVRYIRPSILGIDAATNQSVVGILENEQFKSSFLYPFISGEVPRLMGLRTGAQQPHINKRTIDETRIVLPGNDSLQKYYKIANPIFSEIMTLAFETKHLTQLRDWLLPMLMNGQVSVR
jgi:type I restriction enzyme S subunit